MTYAKPFPDTLQRYGRYTAGLVTDLWVEYVRPCFFTSVSVFWVMGAGVAITLSRLYKTLFNADPVVSEWLLSGHVQHTISAIICVAGTAWVWYFNYPQFLRARENRHVAELSQTPYPSEPDKQHKYHKLLKKALRSGNFSSEVVQFLGTCVPTKDRLTIVLVILQNPEAVVMLICLYSRWMALQAFSRDCPIATLLCEHLYNKFQVHICKKDAEFAEAALLMSEYAANPAVIDKVRYASSMGLTAEDLGDLNLAHTDVPNVKIDMSDITFD